MLSDEREGQPVRAVTLRRSLATTVAALEGELAASRRRERDLQQELEAATSVKKLPPLDLVIALGTTGSMTNEITALRKEIAGLADLLSHLTDDAALGIISFKDRCEPGGPIQTISLQAVDSAGVSRLTAFARSLWPGGAGCNNTHPEAYAAALRAAVNSPWRSSSERRSIVMISDNPAYVDEQNRAVTEAGAFARQPGSRQTVSGVRGDRYASPGHADLHAARRQRGAGRLRPGGPERLPLGHHPHRRLPELNSTSR